MSDAIRTRAGSGLDACGVRVNQPVLLSSRLVLGQPCLELGDPGLELLIGVALRFPGVALRFLGLALRFLGLALHVPADLSTV